MPRSCPTCGALVCSGACPEAERGVKAACCIPDRESPAIAPGTPGRVLEYRDGVVHVEFEHGYLQDEPIRWWCHESEVLDAS